MSLFGACLSVSAEVRLTSNIDSLRRVFDIQYQQGDYYDAIEYQKLILTNCRVEEDQTCKLEGLFNIANIYVNYTTDHSLALEYLNQALKEAKRLDNHSFIIQVSQLIGYVYYTQKDYQTALDYYQKAIVVASEIEDKQTLSELYAYLGNFMEELNDTSSAIDYYLKSIKIERKTNFELARPQVLIATGRYHLLQGDTATTMTKYEDARKKFLETKNYRWAAYTLSELAKLLTAKGNYKKAIDYAMQGHKLAKHYKLRKEQVDNLFALYLAYEKNLQFDKAIRCLKEHNILRDSIYSKENAASIALWQKKVINQDNENKIIVLEHQAKIERLRTYLTIGMCFILVLVSLVLYQLLKRKKIAANLLEEKVQHSSLELETANKNLSAQIQIKEKTTDALKQSEVRNKALIKAIPDYIFKVTSKGIILDYHCNQIHRMFNVPDDILFCHVKRLLPPFSLNMLLTAIQTVLVTRQMQLFEFELTIHSERESFEGRVTWAGKKELIVLIRNITEKKWQETKVLSTIIQTQEQERKRFASDLHDGLGQTLLRRT
ncbi:MAG: tetratricopeptide repeat protein [Flavobacteriales bacterium]|nr:tetratricopeptide repeat protein [Flavobacteriales bacterium]